MDEKIQMTQDGYDKLEKEYRHLIDVEKPENVAALSAARAQGDLSENADYDAARNRQSEIEARIQEIEYIKTHCVIVDISVDTSKVSLGSLVTYSRDGRNATVKISGTIEADPLAEIPLVSNESALGKGLLGHGVGDTCHIEATHPYDIEIVRIERTL